MNYKVKFILLTQLLTPYIPLSASSECTLAGFAGDYVEAYRSRGMVDDCYYQIIDDVDKARSAQAEVVGLLAEGYRRAGYKVGLTDRKAQEMFGISQPLVGVLFKQMLQQDGAEIALDFRNVVTGGTGPAGAGKIGRHQPGRIG